MYQWHFANISQRLQLKMFGSPLNGKSDWYLKLTMFCQKAENASDDATRELHQYISRVKQQPEVRKGYMRFEEIIASERKEAAEEAASEAAINTYIQNILELLENIEEVPDELCEKLNVINDIPTLKKCFKIAAKANSIDEFAEKAFCSHE